MKRKRAPKKDKLQMPLTKKTLENTDLLMAENHVMNDKAKEPENTTSIHMETENPKTSTSATINRDKLADLKVEKTGYESLKNYPKGLSEIVVNVIKEISKEAGGLANLTKNLVDNSIKNEQINLPHADMDLEENENQHHQNPEYKQEELNAALTVIKKTMKLHASDPFNKPVDPVELGIPDYFDVIDTPMDFGTICNNLENGLKYMNSLDVFKDVQYIWGNCVKYNKKGDYIFDLMKHVKAPFMKYWKAAGLQESPPIVESSIFKEKDNPPQKEAGPIQIAEIQPTPINIQSQSQSQRQTPQSSNHPQSSSEHDDDDLDIYTPGLMARGRRREQTEEVAPLILPAQSWLRFPESLSEEHRRDYNTRLKVNIVRDIDVPYSFDWELADRSLSEAMARHLVREFRDKSGMVRFVCLAWRRLFAMREPIHRELVLEFISTVRFNTNITDMSDSRILAFRLGGQSRECNIQELSWRLGLYTVEETRDPHFMAYLREALRIEPAEFRREEFWATVSRQPYNTQRSVERHLSSPVHRILHRLLTASILHRRGGEKVPAGDIFYMSCLFNRDVLLNIPYTIAMMLGRRVTRRSQSGPICGGHFITRLARSYEITPGPGMGAFTTFQPRDLDATTLVTMQVLERVGEDRFRLRVSDIDEPQVRVEHQHPHPPLDSPLQTQRHRVQSTARPREPRVDRAEWERFGQPPQRSNQPQSSSEHDDDHDIYTRGLTARGRRREQEEEVAPLNFPAQSWLRFPESLGEERRRDYDARLRVNIVRDIDVPYSFDWELAERTGLSEAMAGYLVREFRDESGMVRFVCHAWRRLFAMREPIHRELVFEFISTVRFNTSMTDMSDGRILAFRLGGQSHECSIRELSWRLGLYTVEETRDPHFMAYLTEAVRIEPTEFKREEFWATVSHRPYDTQRTVERHLRSPVHRILHRLLTASILHRRGGEKVPAGDIYYMSCLFRRDVLLNIPYTIAMMLGRSVTGRSQSGPIYGGHFISRLARSYEIALGPDMGAFTTSQPRDLDATTLVTMKILERVGEDRFRLRAPDVDEPQAAGVESQHPHPPPPDRPLHRWRVQSTTRSRESRVDRAVWERFGRLHDERRAFDLGIQRQIEWLGIAVTSLLPGPPHAPFPTSAPIYGTWAGGDSGGTSSAEEDDGVR